MERKNHIEIKSYLTTPVAARVLQVSSDTLDNFAESGVITPLREIVSNQMRLWGPEDIFRAYLALRLKKEFYDKYGGRYDELMFAEIRRDILSVKRVRGREIIQSEEWEKVVRNAAKHGLLFKDGFV